MRKSFLTAAVLVVVFVSTCTVFLPQDSCCEKPDPELEQLVAEARKGDVGAISRLYERAKSNGVMPEAEHWALEGALWGDLSLRAAYLDYYRAMDRLRQERVLARIKERSSMPGATCLRKALGDATVENIICD